jgi:WD40 repeat protein
MDFTGLSPTAIADFVWLHLDNERIVYRKEGEPGIFRPLAVALANPDIDRVNLTPALGHISSLVWSPDNTRLLVTTGGGNGYRELWMIQLDGPTQVQPPLRISEIGEDALVDTQVDVDLATLGHGFDNYGRIWYTYTDSMLADPESVGIKLAVVVDNDVISRTDLTDTAPGLTIHDVAFDANLQLLGYRSQTVNLSSIHYIDLAETMADSVRIDQDFEHADNTPADDAGFAWSPDGSRLVIVGRQNAMTSLHVAQLDDPLGTTTEVTLPDVEAAQGITLDHAPRVSPDGEQVILWYSVQDGNTGLVHAPTDGSGEGQVVLGLTYSLRDGTYLQHSPE